MVNHAIKEKKLAHIRYDMCLDGNSDPNETKLRLPLY